MTIRAYLDNNATTRLAPEALAAMTPYLTELYVNPSSAAGDILGLGRPILQAKRELARLLGAADIAQNVFLTSGASEANSWAVHAATAGRAPGHIVSTAIEHPSLMAALAAAQDAGWIVELAQPDGTGRVTAETVEALLKPDTAFVSVMAANNETGVIQPVGEVGRRIRSVCASAIFHVDATQALGRIPVDLDEEFASVDLLSLSAHKFHGPKGIGALVALDDLSLPPIIHGTQQGGRRGGTPDAAAAAALAVSARIAREQLPRIDQVLHLRDRFESVLAQAFPRVRFIGQAADRLPNTSCFVIAGLEAEAAVEALAQQGIVVAMGSACTSGSPAPSHVLTAMGLTYAEAKASLRVSLSRETTWQELQLAIEALQDIAALAA